MTQEQKQEGKCAGCKVLFDEIRDTEKIKEFGNELWCEFCYKRRLDNVPRRIDLTKLRY